MRLPATSPTGSRPEDEHIMIALCRGLTLRQAFMAAPASVTIGYSGFRARWHVLNERRKPTPRRNHVQAQAKTSTEPNDV